jgi:hypothetical protein
MGGWFMKILIRSAENLLVVLDGGGSGGGGGGGGSSSSSILLEVFIYVKFREYSFLCSTVMTVAVVHDQDTSHRKKVSDDNVGLTFLIKQLS